MISISLFYCCGKAFTHMNTWMMGKNETLPEKEDFYSHLNIADITDADYTHAKKTCKDFQRKSFVEYHNLYVQKDTLLLAEQLS